MSQIVKNHPKNHGSLKVKYKHHYGLTGWEGIKDSLEELGRIRKTTIDFGVEKTEKITVLTKEQKEIIEKLDISKSLFKL